MTVSEYFNRVYDLLTNYGASPSKRDRFVQYMCEDHSGHEYRFMGIFGFGGKCRRDSYDNRVSVDYYWESKTPELDAKCKELNEKISALPLPEEWK